LKTRILAILIVFNSLGTEAQIRHPGKPVPLDIFPVSGIPVIAPSCNHYERRASDDIYGQTRLKTDHHVFLCEMNADYNNTGTWHILKDGRSIWRTGIYVRDAVALSLVFSRFKLEKGASVFLYDENQEEILGAYTYRNNKESGIFAASPVHSDLIYVELQLMNFVTTPGELEIGYAAVDYQARKSTDAVLDTFYRMSGGCNVDINCNTDPEIQEVKYAVIRVVYDGVERCTGTLINTTRMDGYPFVLTAGHCIDNQKRANTALFYFNYESPVCGGRDGSTAFSISGSDLLATTDNKLDFSLLELSEPVPFYYHPYFAGWDNRNGAPGSSYTIHHPQGDVKKISVDSDPAVTANYGEGYDANTHWRILEWDSGTTEKGSSGCPLFDVNNRVVGTLTGGSAMCGYSYDDYFQKIYHCWADYPSPSNQLQFWLDPMQKSIGFIDGYDPYGAFWASGDTLTNILEEDITWVYSYHLSWGYNSGHNSDSVRLFAEKFNTASDAEIIGLILNVGPLNAGSADSKIRLQIWNEELVPGKIIYTVDVPLFDLAANEDFLAVFDSSVSVGKEFYAGFEIFYDTPGDTFAVNMQMNNETDGKNTAFVRSNAGWQLLTDYLGLNLNASFDIRPVIFDSIPEPHRPDIKPPENDVFIYPVPADVTLNITFWELPRYDVKIDLYDATGRLVKSELYKSPPVTIEYFLNKIPSGMYIIKMNVNNFIITKKFIVVSEY
jgi:lysyl endopeptidase